MPQIIVTAGSGRDVDEAAVLLRERVNASDFDSERFTRNLVERLGWAVEDATAAERGEPETTEALTDAVSAGQYEPDYAWDPYPAGVA